MKGTFNDIKNLYDQFHYYLFTLITTLYTTTFLVIKGTTLISYRAKNLQALALLEDDESMNEDTPGRSCKRKINLSEKQEEYKSEYEPGFQRFKQYSKKVFPIKKVNVMENLRDLGNLAAWRNLIKAGVEEKGCSSSFFSDKYEEDGSSNFYTTFMLSKEMIRISPFKEFGGSIKIYFHGEKCEESKREKNLYSCRSFFFTEKLVEATTIEELKKKVAIWTPTLVEDLMESEKVYVFGVNIINCLYPDISSHSVCLVVSGGGSPDGLRAFYCDSCGENIPRILDDFLIEVLGVKANDVYCFRFQQQDTEGFCNIFSLNNNLNIGDSVLERVSYTDMEKEAEYCPNEDQLLEIREYFIKNFNKRICNSFIYVSFSFNYFLNKLFKKLEKHSVLKNEETLTKVIFLKKKREALSIVSKSVRQLLKKERIESRDIANLPDADDSFFKFSLFKEDQKWIEVYLVYFLKLNHEYYEHLETKLKQKLLEFGVFDCYGCIEKVMEKVETKKKKKEYYLEAYKDFFKTLSDPSWRISSWAFEDLSYDEEERKEIKAEKSNECPTCKKILSTSKLLLPITITNNYNNSFHLS